MENWGFLAVVCFLGLFLGWFFRNGITIWAIIALVLFAPIFGIMMDLDMLLVTLAFSVGFLIHTWKPLYRKLREL
ncbi:MAG: hypothetical protein OCD00_19400 [Colwellia sp.]